MNYKQFRTEVVAKGCIIRGGVQSMTVFTPRARLELNNIGEVDNESRYTVFNFTTSQTLDGSYSLSNVLAFAFDNIGVIDMYSWYLADWRVSFKGNSLYNIGQLIDNAEASKEDVVLAVSICDEMKYLILMSDFIPDEVKANLCKDIHEVKESFEKIIK